MEIKEELVCACDGMNGTELVEAFAFLLVNRTDTDELFVRGEVVQFGGVFFLLFVAEKFAEDVHTGSSFLPVALLGREREVVSSCYFIPSLCVVRH